jgi:uncharacterized repeat protein (TIGR03803 family)
MKRYLVFDAGCVACSYLARDIERLANGRLEVINLTAWATRELLSQVFPDGWQEQPYLLTVDQGRVSAASGNELALKLLLLLGPQKAWRVLMLAERYGVELPFGGGDFSVQRRRLLQLAAMFSGGLIATRLDPAEARVIPRKKLISQTSAESIEYYFLSEDQATTLDKVATSSPNLDAVKSQLGQDFAPALDVSYVVGRKDSSSDMTAVIIPILYQGQFSLSSFVEIIDPSTQKTLVSVAYTTKNTDAGSQSYEWVNGQLVLDVTSDSQGTITSGYRVENGSQIDLSGQNYSSQGQAAIDSFFEDLNSATSPLASLLIVQSSDATEELKSCLGSFPVEDLDKDNFGILSGVACGILGVIPAGWPAAVVCLLFVGAILIMYNEYKRKGCLVKIKLSRPPLSFGNIEIIHSFNTLEGSYPDCDLVLLERNFYGTAVKGGDHGSGTVFRVAPDGQLKVIHSFKPNEFQSPTTGETFSVIGPRYALTPGSTGFYGTSDIGGEYGDSAVFWITAGGGPEVIASFEPTSINPASGAVSKLTFSSDRRLYGMSRDKQGLLFRVDLANGLLETVVSFDGQNGTDPVGGLVLARDGNLYGVTRTGGTNSYGTIFQLSTPSGILTTVHKFDGQNGYNPCGLTVGRNGDLYGTTWRGPNGRGTFFRLEMSDLGFLGFETLAIFPDDPRSPADAPLTLGNDGKFYGTTFNGSSTSTAYGTVYQITPEGKLTLIATFSGDITANDSGGLIQDYDGTLYGVSSSGGANRLGTVFKIPVSAR